MAMSRTDIETNIRTLRPGCDMQWVNESMLSVEGLAEGFSRYLPRFTLTFFNFQGRQTDFDGIVFRTQFASDQDISLQFVNDLNSKFNFARHYAKDGRLTVESDVALNSNTITPELLELHYTLFSLASERLDSAISARSSEKA